LIFLQPGTGRTSAILLLALTLVLTLALSGVLATGCIRSPGADAPGDTDSDDGALGDADSAGTDSGGTDSGGTDSGGADSGDGDAGAATGDEPPGVSVFDEFTILDAASIEDPKAAAWVAQNTMVPGVHLVRFDDITYVLAARSEKPAPGCKTLFIDARETDEGITLYYETLDPDHDDTVDPIVDHPILLLTTGREPGEVVGLETQGPEVFEFVKLPASNSAVIVAEPLVGSSVTSPLTVRGWARIFEGTVQIRLEDGHNVLFEGFTTANDGPPAWGEFEITIEFDPPTSPVLTLLVYEQSARDGSEVNRALIPLEWNPGEEGE